MIYIYAIGLPKNYITRFMFFQSEEKANEIRNALQKEHPLGASSGFQFNVTDIPVYEDKYLIEATKVLREIGELE